MTDYPDRPKPRSYEEVIALKEANEIEVMLAEDLPDGTTRMLICDNRRTYEEGEIYEIII